MIANKLNVLIYFFFFQNFNHVFKVKEDRVVELPKQTTPRPKYHNSVSNPTTFNLKSDDQPSPKIEVSITLEGLHRTIFRKFALSPVSRFSAD